MSVNLFLFLCLAIKNLKSGLKYGYIWDTKLKNCMHMGVRRLFMTKGPAAEPTRQTHTLLEHVGDNHTNVFLRNLQCSLTQLRQLLHILQYKSLGTLFAKPASTKTWRHTPRVRPRPRSFRP